MICTLRERDVEDALVKWLSKTSSLKVHRQVPIPPIGVMDVLTVDEYPKNLIGLTIYELKKGPIGLGAVEQLLRYMDAVRRWHEDLWAGMSIKDIPRKQLSVRGVLVGREIIKRVLLDHLDDVGRVSCLSYAAGPEGVVFREVSWAGQPLIENHKPLASILGNFRAVD